MYESLRRRIATVRTDTIDATYKPSLHDRGYYLPVDDPRNKWVDDEGRTHIEVPAKLTDKGRRYNMPHQEIVLDIPRCRAPTDGAKTQG